jgi:hypothetical protein
LRAFTKMGRIKELTFLRFAHFCTAIASGGSSLAALLLNPDP